uniref:GPN-loop GTPase 2 n=1 Tax=Timema tahoe TaxID=61484 RepID=A0A7R9FGF3_9NEOP|nr:unnamed protein product [Timema tahoe]
MTPPDRRYPVETLLPSGHLVTQTSDDTNVGLKYRHIDVGIKVGPGGDDVNYSLELCVVAHDSQSVKGINQGQGIAVWTNITSRGRVFGLKGRVSPCKTWLNVVDKCVKKRTMKSFKNKKACMTRCLDVVEAKGVCENKEAWMKLIERPALVDKWSKAGLQNMSERVNEYPGHYGKRVWAACGWPTWQWENYILPCHRRVPEKYRKESGYHPANDDLKYEAAINISQLITLEDVMVNLKLGPNGGLMFCMEFLEKNMDWWNYTHTTTL